MISYAEGRPMGPNVSRLLRELIAIKAIPPGGGFQEGLSYLLNADVREQVNRKAVAFLDEHLADFRKAPDNPFGDDDEAIAAAILTAIDEKRDRR